MVQESRRKYWDTRSSIHLFACLALLARSAALTHSLPSGKVNDWIAIFAVFYSVLDHSALRFLPPTVMSRAMIGTMLLPLFTSALLSAITPPGVLPGLYLRDAFRLLFFAFFAFVSFFLARGKLWFSSFDSALNLKFKLG